MKQNEKKSISRSIAGLRASLWLSVTMATTTNIPVNSTATFLFPCYGQLTTSWCEWTWSKRSSSRWPSAPPLLLHHLHPFFSFSDGGDAHRIRSDRKGGCGNRYEQKMGPRWSEEEHLSCHPPLWLLPAQVSFMFHCSWMKVRRRLKTLSERLYDV